MIDYHFISACTNKKLSLKDHRIEQKNIGKQIETDLQRQCSLVLDHLAGHVVEGDVLDLHGRNVDGRASLNSVVSCKGC